MSLILMLFSINLGLAQEQGAWPRLRTFLESHSACDITGLELIYVKAGSGVESMWGHNLLVFKTETEDYALGIDVVTGERNKHVKMMVGDIALDIQFDTLKETEKKYVQDAKREMISYPLKMERLDVAMLLVRLQGWTNSPESMGDYSFFKNNCARVIEELIVEASKEPLRGHKPIRPWRVDNYLEKNDLIEER